MERAEYATMFRVEETHWWYAALHRLIFQALDAELPDWRKKNVLDVGCGTGAILKQLGSALPFADASFDAVICSSVLYHQWVRDVEGAAREMHRVLRPSGVLLINVPAFPFLHSAHDEAVMTARRFRKWEIRQLLQKQNFEIRRLTYWTTFLFPLAVAARTLGGSKKGRDFETEGASFPQRTFSKIMALERRLLRNISLPFGVALLAVARRQSTM